MLKVAIVTPIEPSYSETFLRAHLERLPFKIYHFHSTPKMGYFPIYGPGMRPLSSDNKWVNYAETALDRLLGIGYSLRINKMTRIIREEGIQVMLAEYGPVGAFMTEVCRKAGIPLVVHFFGIDAYRYSTLKRFDQAYKKMFDQARAMVVVSKDMGKQLESLGADADKVFYNPCSPSTEAFTYQDAGKRPPVFVAIGRFTPKKSPLLTLKAFHRVCERNPEARLIMVGDGPLWEEAKALARDLGIAERVDFPGPAAHEKLPDYYHAARAFVQHSVRAEDGDSEGTPVAVLEAMASGLPVVSTRHAGIKDVVVEGETGLLVEEGDWEAMGEAMNKIAADPGMATRMGENGFRRQRAHYTLELHLQRLTEVIEMAAKGR